MFYDKNGKQYTINVFQIQNYSPQVFSLSQNATKLKYGKSHDERSTRNKETFQFKEHALNSQSEGRLPESSLGAFFTVPFNSKSKNFRKI